jgi:hypothetical protein|tara:strand:- start:1477 stop:2073 length:597 start_codon:yes stop_codon:yes gene_type:complete
MHRDNKGIIHFDDYPEFQPNLTPREIFEMGSFGGTYWRPIHSSIVNKDLKNQHRSKKWNINKIFEGLDDNILTKSKCDIKINKYKVRVGQSLEEWEKDRNGGSWIREDDPYGWVQWYCRFYNGRRLKNGEDERQISRWAGIASERGRFRRWLVTLILKNNSDWDDFTVSPSIRQTLQHWAYKLTQDDYQKDVNRRNEK